MKPARRSRARSALPPSPEALERRLARVEEKLGTFQAEIFIQFEGEAPRNCSPSGTRKVPIAGDTLIWFPSLDDNAADTTRPECELRRKLRSHI